MNDLAMDHSDMTRGSTSLHDAGRAARGATGSSALDALASGVPGSSTAGLVPTLKSDWTSGVEGWSADVVAFAEDVEGTSSSTRATDEGSGGLLGVFSDAVGG